MGFWGSVGGVLSDGFGLGSGDPTNADRSQLQQSGQGALNFAGQGAQNYQQNQAGLNQSIGALQAQAQGQNSVSAMQLQQGLQQNLAAQQAMAASAAPQNAAAAARTAAIQSGQLGAGLAGQQALAGLQERNQAQQQLGQLQLGQSQQNQQAALGGYGAANNAYGTAIQNPQKGWGQIAGGLVSGAAAAAVKSDRRAKTDIESGDAAANATLGRLGSYLYNYKDQKDGKGRQLGVMAQDLEGTDLRSAVINTPNGKYVDAGKAALGGLSLTAALARRVAALEGKQ